MYKYHCLNPISRAGLGKLDENYKKTEQADEADVILVRSAKMHDMEFGPNLKAIARAGAGVNNIPLDRCAENGIVVFNTPGANANGVKELVIAGMLLAARDVIGGINWVQEHEEDGDLAKLTEKSKKAFAGTEISGKKLGVIGLGAIGVLVANAAVHLGMDVYGYDPYVSVDSAWRLSRNIHHAKTVDELYRECDYITIHVPALKDTIGMIDKNAISLMKKNVVILNFARDTLVNSEDMVDALGASRELSSSRIWVHPQRNPRITVQRWQWKRSEISLKTEISHIRLISRTARWERRGHCLLWPMAWEGRMQVRSPARLLWKPCRICFLP